MKTKYAIGRAIATGAAVIALAACNANNAQEPMAGHDMSPSGAPSASGPSASPTAAANQADKMFAAMMIPHHQQAISMSDLILAKKDLDPEIKELAEQIKGAQRPEIDTMNRWLEEWGGPPDHSGHGSDDGGMMTPEEMRELRAADTDKAQTMFLEGMIEHHQGAIKMAETEIADGENPDAIAMAESIVTSQQEEITTMQGILDRL